MVQLCSYARGAALLLLLLLLQKFANAQDMTFTQFYFNKAMINPAYVGQKGDLTVNMIHKQQWTRLPERGFGDMHLSAFNAEIGCPRLNIAMGASLMYTEEGVGRYSQLYGAYSFSWSVRGNYSSHLKWRRMRNRHFMFSFGAQVGMGQKMLDWSRLTFTDQYDPYYGLVSPVSAAYSTGITDVSSMQPDISFGLLYRTELWTTRSYLTLGSALFHVNEPLESFLYTQNRIPRRFSVHAVWHQRLKQRLYGKESVFINIGWFLNQHMSVGGSWPAINTSNIFFTGLVFPNQSYDIGLRTTGVTNLEFTSIVVLGNWRMTEALFLSLGAEFSTPPSLPINQVGMTFDIGLTFSFENFYLCGGGRKEWCFDQFTREFVKFGPRNNMQNAVP